MQLIVPRNNVLKEMNDGASGGHLGVNKSIDKIRKRFCWLHLRHNVEEWYMTYEICAANKTP